MQAKIQKIINESLITKSLLLDDKKTIDAIREAAVKTISSLKRGGKVICFGNGGSAADSQHFAAELIGRFQKERKSFSAIALSTDSSIITSLSNDYSYDIVFKRQIEGLAKPSDVAFAISTSGKSKSVIEGLREAKKRGLLTICLTGNRPSPLRKIADIPICAPSSITARIQEIHILIIHILCELIEEAF